MKNVFILVLLLLVFSSLCFSADIMIVVDNQAAGKDAPRVEQFYSFLKSVVFSESDQIGLVRAGKSPLLLYPPTGNGFSLPALLTKELTSQENAPALADAVAFAVRQLDAYNSGETEKQLYILTTGSGIAGSITKPQNVETFVFLIGDVPVNDKNALSKITANIYEVKTAADVHSALVSHLYSLNTAYHEKNSFVFDDQEAVLTITLANTLSLERFFKTRKEAFVFIRAIVPAALEDIQINTASLKNGDVMVVDGSRVLFTSVNMNRQEYSALKIISPVQTSYTLAFPEGTKIITENMRVLVNTAVNWPIVIIAVLAVLVLAILGFWRWLSLRKPVWDMTIKTTGGKTVCQADLARLASKKIYSPGSLLRIVEQAKEDDKTDVSALAIYTIKVRGGTWKLLDEKGEEVISDFADGSAIPLKGAFKISIDKF